MSDIPNNHFQFSTIIADLAETRRKELGLSKTDLIRQFGYANLGKGHRKYNDFLAGKIEHHLILDNLAKALSLDPETISSALDRTRTNFVEAAQREKERIETEWRDNFKVHGIIETERRIPQPIFAAALTGSVKHKMVELDTSKHAPPYTQQVIDEIPNRVNSQGDIIAFGKPVGVVINLSPDHAIRYDLDGNQLEMLQAAARLGEARMGVR